MCDELVWSFDAITGLPWLELIKALAPVGTAFIAFLALQNWRRQDRAKRHADFLDQLVEAVHDYTARMSKPIELALVTKVGMQSHAMIGSSDEPNYRGTIVFIKEHGKEQAKLLLNALGECQPAVVRLKSLAAKGRVFKFKDYQVCRENLAALLFQFDHIHALASVTGSPSWNWENPDILRVLKAVMKADTGAIQKTIDEKNAAILDYVAETYENIYGKRKA